LERIPRLADPLGALKSISRDRTWKWRVRDARGRAVSAVRVQQAYWELVRDFCPRLEPEWLAAHKAWEEILVDLERDPLSTADRLDWAAKFKLIEQFRAAEKISEDDPWLRSLDLAYHLLDRQQGLFFGLLDQGAFKLPFPWSEITGHSLCPPTTTRAAVRGRCVEKFGAAVQATQWDYLLLKGAHMKIELDLRNLFDPEEVRQSLKLISAARSVEDLAQLRFAKVL
jgi:proteasome accessory factor A